MQTDYNKNAEAKKRVVKRRDTLFTTAIISLILLGDLISLTYNILRSFNTAVSNEQLSEEQLCILYRLSLTYIVPFSLIVLMVYVSLTPIICTFKESTDRGIKYIKNHDKIKNKKRYNVLGVHKAYIVGCANHKGMRGFKIKTEYDGKYTLDYIKLDYKITKELAKTLLNSEITVVEDGLTCKVIDGNHLQELNGICGMNTNDNAIIQIPKKLYEKAGNAKYGMYYNILYIIYAIGSLVTLWGIFNPYTIELISDSGTELMIAMNMYNAATYLQQYKLSDDIIYAGVMIPIAVIFVMELIRLAKCIMFDKFYKDLDKKAEEIENGTQESTGEEGI